ncbi:MAG TPA: SulP family inorganic anion transporter [Methylomirabilota bacterium]|nr:SulP family inorganic anion transporter [Methylomirabilota bacterium]
MRDVLAGFTLAAMNIPQVLGYTKIAGTPVVTGLYTLLLPVVAFAAFGSSRYLVVAADSATAAILAGGVLPMAPAASPHYVELAGMVALLAAGFLLIARLLKLGFIADFLSQTVLAGFLTGVGIQVGIAVLGEMLGVPVDTHKTLEQLAQVVSGLGEAHLGTMGISAAVVAVIVLSHRISPQLPGPLFAVAGATAASAVFDFAGHGVNVIGPIMGGLPRLRLPLVRGAEVIALLPVAVSCFVMIVAQSAATARAYAFRHREALDENADLGGLSAANVAAAVTGTFVVNGSPTQTAMVDRSGGRSQLAHLVVAALVAIVLLVLTGPLQYLPRCALGAIVFTIALRLVDLRGLRDIQRESPGEFLLAAGTAAVVVAIGVGQGIVLAMAYSLLRHVRHSYRPHSAVLVEDAGASWRPTPAVPGVESAPGLIVFQFGADLFYANADRFAGDVRGLVDRALTPVRWLIVDAGAITSVDYSAARVLRALVDDLSRGGVAVFLVHAEASLLGDLRRHRLTDVAAPGRAFNTLREALAVIRGAEGKDGV